MTSRFRSGSRNSKSPQPKARRSFRLLAPIVVGLALATGAFGCAGQQNPRPGVERSIRVINYNEESSEENDYKVPVREGDIVNNLGIGGFFSPSILIHAIDEEAVTIVAIPGLSVVLELRVRYGEYTQCPYSHSSGDGIFEVHASRGDKPGEAFIEIFAP